MTLESGLNAERVSLAYGDRVVSQDLSVAIRPGAFTAIIGPNGCGKSTLLRAFARLLNPKAGQVVLDGRDIATMRSKALARQLGLLPQSAIAPDGIRVVDLVARGRYPHQGAFDRWSERDEAAVATAMRETGVTEFSGRLVDELSGGQRQRVWIAMTLAQETATLLLDEPTTFLDIGHQIDVLNLFARINSSSGRTIVAVLHDLNHAARYADVVVAMRDGDIVAQGPPADVFTPGIVEKVFDLPCRVIEDPVAGTPLVVPVGDR
ncbi:ABC transporter ATP-binding protein [Stackebrandtia nassauensis]|uniref:ABC transporter related protein n=1 Tax=Stackebrandtia nassauensis (strain DSM 44728 / CIP 108903 / NRRL B-16338 / NBRC 102104 / LLR-40K-21) TaxID=446470 RepID=D3Q8B8_STANL|nr:ABC transporter ATP-binding protein [Stackebrandtia nassauensis]ADD42492.1 ABC transporter related protein [Stackebrandtia nassauensis DSM 44728]